MKKENEIPVENLENKPDGKPQPDIKKSAKPKKSPKPKKEKKSPSGVRLPVLLEFTYTFSILILVFLSFGIIITSFLSGANLFTIVLRTTVANLVVGGLLVLISSQISSGLLFAAKVEQEEAQKKQEEKTVDNVTLSASEGSLTMKIGDSSVAANAPSHRPDALSGE